MSTPIPTQGQLAWQQTGFGIFHHFGLNTYHGLEWSDGTLPADSFNPVDLDADQWVQLAKDAGAGYVVLTAKHHDGFCLWPTSTTDYSVKSSPWKNGQGDVVREVEQACRRHGIGFGLYLSPWDRNAECYPDAAAYDDFYATQLEELCTNYGELVEIWFDGAGSQGREYDWPRIAALIDRTQPGAMVFNMGRPTIRWVGNEDGLASDPVEYVVASTKLDQYTTHHVDLAEQYYLPPECDVSIRRGWFFQPEQEPKTLEHLLGIHYRSYGLGAGLLLNLPPNREGLIPEQDAARVREWAAELQRRFGEPIAATISVEGDQVVADFGTEVEFDHLELREDLTAGQRIFTHAVTTGDDTIAHGQTVGVRRRHVFAPVTTDRVVITALGADGEPDPSAISGVVGYLTGHSTAPVVPDDYRAPTETPDDVAAHD